MKNVKKIIVLTLVALFGLTNVNATSNWDVQREEFKKLTDGIKPDSSKEELKLIYTIPEDFDGDKIYINASKELLDIIEGLYVPGQSSDPFTIEIINKSKYTYNYVNNSFKLNTKDMSILGNSDEYYSYDINNNENGIYINGYYRQPTFLYESVLNIIGFLLIVFVVSRIFKKEGCQFYAYFIWYGITRFIVETYRSDSLMLGSIKMAQLTSVVFIVLGIIGMIIIYYKDRKGQQNV